MVTQEDKHRIPIPGLFCCLLEEDSQCIIGIFHYLQFLLLAVCVEPFGDDVGWMIADAEQSGHEGLLLLL